MTASDERWLVAVCAGRWQAHGIARARAAGLRVLALDGDPRAPGLAVADRARTVDIRDPAAVVAAVEASGLVPSGAIAFVSDVGMAAAAALRRRYGLPGPDPDLTIALTNKARQRELWQRHGIPGPRWRSASSADEADAAVERIGYPAVVKPADSSGSRGVSVVRAADAFSDAVARAFAASPGGTIMIEALMEGTEYTVESFGCHGSTHVLAVTSKRKVRGTANTVASELSTEPSEHRLTRRIAGTAAGALEALGYREGPGHTEIIVGPDGEPRLVEAAGRGGGFMLFEGLVPLVSGYDIATASALQAVGLPVPPVGRSRRAALLRFLPSRPGTVRSITGFDEANAIPGVRAEPFVRVGNLCDAARTDGDRLAGILASADTLAEATERADRAERTVGIVVEETSAAAGH